jgi:exonuclease SbcC
MIPLKLQLKNFISYGSCQIIDLAPYHLICLTGKNGHGKSALLDAITWAIWGQARKVSGSAKPDEKLVRLGQSHMFVTLDFISNNQTYRVRREFTLQQGKASSYLDFGIVQENGVFKALTDKTMRVTQDKIDHAIGLSYDSFINSVFLRQGQSNEFSKKTPQERKEILASILGLQQYEELRKKAQEKTKLLHSEKERLTFSFKAAQSTIQELGNTPQELNATLALLRTQVEVIQENQTKSIVLQQEIVQLQQKAMSLQLQEEQRKKNENEIHHLKNTVSEKIVIWRQCNKQLHVQDDSLIAQLQQELQQHEHLLQEFQSATNQMQELTHRQTLIQQDLAQTLAREQLELHHTQNTYKQRLIQAESFVKEFENNLKQVVQEQSALEQQDKALLIEKNNLDTILSPFETIKKRFEKRKEYYYRYSNKYISLKASLDDLQKQNHALLTTCPLCEQDVDDQRAQQIHTLLQKKECVLQHRVQRLTSIMPRLKKYTAEDYAHVQQLQTTHEKRISIIERLQEIHNKKIECIKKQTLAHEQLQQQKIVTDQYKDELQKIISIQIPSLEKRCLEHSELQTLNKTMSEAHIVLAKNTYNAQKHEASKQRFNNALLMQGSFSHDALAIMQQERRKQIHDIIQQIKQLQKQKSDIHVSAIPQVQTELSAKQMALLQTQQLLVHLQKEQENLMHQRGTLEVRTTLLKTAEQSEQEYSKQLLHLDVELTDYALLQQALSKEGIQALLIEHALPELEHEANNLLAKLTDNQASLKIESLRDLKTGGTKETLDITISDAAGTRAYELFSGGEAFRIDFALRVALSKLLARRAGTTLQTLIIDEGFGSQDDEGLANIMEALHRIQDEFAKIIIVSHLPSMKEQFPVNFYINKGADGSTIQVFQQG